jgi:type IV secretory pathway TrbL component
LYFYNSPVCEKEKVDKGNSRWIFLAIITIQSGSRIKNGCLTGSIKLEFWIRVFFWPHNHPVYLTLSIGIHAMKKSLLLATLLAAIAMTACSKKEEAPVEAPAAAVMDAAKEGAAATMDAAKEGAAATMDAAKEGAAAATDAAAAATDAAKEGAAAAVDAAKDAAGAAADAAKEAADKAADAAKDAAKPAQ